MPLSLHFWPWKALFTVLLKHSWHSLKEVNIEMPLFLRVSLLNKFHATMFITALRSQIHSIMAQTIRLFVKRFLNHYRIDDEDLINQIYDGASHEIWTFKTLRIWETSLYSFNPDFLMNHSDLSCSNIYSGAEKRHPALFNVPRRNQTQSRQYSFTSSNKFDNLVRNHQYHQCLSAAAIIHGTNFYTKFQPLSVDIDNCICMPLGSNSYAGCILIR